MGFPVIVNSISLSLRTDYPTPTLVFICYIFFFWISTCYSNLSHRLVKFYSNLIHTSLDSMQISHTLIHHCSDYIFLILSIPQFVLLFFQIIIYAVILHFSSILFSPSYLFQYYVLCCYFFPRFLIISIHYNYVVFTCWSGSEECGFLPLQRLLPLNEKEVGVPLRGPHPFLEWGVGVGLPLGEVGVGI